MDQSFFTLTPLQTPDKQTIRRPTPLHTFKNRRSDCRWWWRKSIHYNLWPIEVQMTAAMLTNITPDALSKIPSRRFSLALIISYRKAQTSSCEFSRASVSLMDAIGIALYKVFLTKNPLKVDVTKAVPELIVPLATMSVFSGTSNAGLYEKN